MKANIERKTGPSGSATICRRALFYGKASMRLVYKSSTPTRFQWAAQPLRAAAGRPSIRRQRSASRARSRSSLRGCRSPAPSAPKRPRLRFPSLLGVGIEGRPSSSKDARLSRGRGQNPISMSETRKLAAILATDVVGYSRLADVHEDRTLPRLRALRGDLIATIAMHHGRVFKRTGDGALVELT